MMESLQSNFWWQHASLQLLLTKLAFTSFLNKQCVCYTVVEVARLAARWPQEEGHQIISEYLEVTDNKCVTLVTYHHDHL